MNGVGITYLWLGKEFPPFIRLEGRRGDYEVYTLERTCIAESHDCGDGVSGLYCSECGNYIDENDNYCPSCGARVEKGDNND